MANWRMTNSNCLAALWRFSGTAFCGCCLCFVRFILLGKTSVVWKVMCKLWEISASVYLIDMNGLLLHAGDV